MYASCPLRADASRRFIFCFYAAPFVLPCPSAAGFAVFMDTAVVGRHTSAFIIIAADGDESTKSASIKEQMESKYGPTWHCVVGGDFRAEVSYEVRTRNILFYIICFCTRDGVLINRKSPLSLRQSIFCSTTWERPPCCCTRRRKNPPLWHCVAVAILPWPSSPSARPKRISDRAALSVSMLLLIGVKSTNWRRINKAARSREHLPGAAPRVRACDL